LGYKRPMAIWGAGFLRAFIQLFVTIDPIALAAIFLAMSRDVDLKERAHIARQATWTGGFVALLFMFFGAAIFAAVGVSVSDFQIAGGLILLIIAGRDIVQSVTMQPSMLSEDFGVVPLGMPLIAGPATITTLLLLEQTQGVVQTLCALALNLLLVALAFAYSDRLEKLVTMTGLRAISKIIALLLAAIAVRMIRRGMAG
jgi:multiple antibiotic resistance protein